MTRQPRAGVTCSVAQFDAPAIDELLEFGANRVLERRRLVFLEALLVDALGAVRSIDTAVAHPALVVLRRGQQRAVEAGSEALHRVGGAEEVPAVPDLDVRVEGERTLVDLQR